MNTPETEFDDGLTEFHEEWLSAYLDGELTEAQRQIVETRLANDPAAQEMLGDLERIRGLVRELPGWNGSGLNLNVAALSDSPPDASSVLDASDVQLQSVIESDEPEADASLNKPAQFLPPHRKSSRAWWRPVALAASLLAMVGIGYALWLPKAQRDNLAVNALDVESTSSPEAVADTEMGRTGGEGMEEQAAPPESSEYFAESENLPAGQMGQGEPVAESIGAPPPRAELWAMPQEAASGVAADPQQADNNFGFKVPQDLDRARGAVGDERLPNIAMSEQVAENGAVAIEIPKRIGDNELRQLMVEDLANSGGREVYFARSLSWTPEAMQRELSSNQALSQLQAETTTRELGFDGDDQQPAHAPVAVARIPENADGKELFERLLVENSLVAEASLISPTTVPAQSNTRFDSQTLALADNFQSQPNEGLESLGAPMSAAPPVPAVPPNSTPLPKSAEAAERNGVRSGGASAATQTQSVVLFLTRAVAEQILKELQPGNAQAEGRGNYLWIIPAAGKDAKQDDDRVILLMNSVGK